MSSVSQALSFFGLQLANLSLSSPGLEDASEGSFSDVADVLDVVAGVLQGQQPGVEQQGHPLVHGVGVEALQQQLRGQGAQRRGLQHPAGMRAESAERRHNGQDR